MALSKEIQSDYRKIIHIDMDCFFAAVAMRDNPDLATKPLAIGGLPTERGVIAACNYPARQYGVHSAMSSQLALQKCPSLVLLPPTMDKYREDSRILQQLFQSYTPWVEPLSLDEAYLDVTAITTPHTEITAMALAQQLRKDIANTLRLTASAGVGPNKCIAKLASDWDKPDGCVVIPPQRVASFMKPLPLRRLPGIGPVRAQRLQNLGYHTCNDLQKANYVVLQQVFGAKHAPIMMQLCRGIDHRPVVSQRIRKSISVEKTYIDDLPNLLSAQQALTTLIKRLIHRWQNAGIKIGAIRGCFVKLKTCDWNKTTVEAMASNIDPQQLEVLLRQAWQRYNLPCRLLGVGVRLRSPLDEISAMQGDFWENEIR
ncbi:MAG: DNA polymerase IV [Gammaproteobacteria bacterium]